MADAKITALDNLATPAVEDLVAIVDDVVGTPTTKKSTLQVIADLFKDLTQTLTNKTLTNPVINYTDTSLSINVKCRVSLGTAQNNIAANTWTKVLLDTESYDIGGDFASYKFTAPVTGYYFVTGSVLWNTKQVDSHYDMAIYKNGVGIANAYIVPGGNYYINPNISDVVYLGEDDYLELYARTADSTATSDITANAAQTFMSVHLLSI